MNQAQINLLNKPNYSDDFFQQQLENSRIFFPDKQENFIQEQNHMATTQFEVPMELMEVETKVLLFDLAFLHYY